MTQIFLFLWLYQELERDRILIGREDWREEGGERKKSYKLREWRERQKNGGWEREKVLLLRHGSLIFFYLIEDLMNHAQQTAKQGEEK